MATKKMRLALVPLLVLAAIFPSCGVPQEEYETIQAQLTSVQKEYEAATSALQASQDEIKGLKAELTSQSATLTDTQSSNDDLQKRVSEIENKLNAVLDTKVVQYYTFHYERIDYDWTLPIPLRDYFYYKDQTRLTGSLKYVPMSTDPHGDAVINIVVGHVEDANLIYDLKPTDTVNLVAEFIQTMTHTNKKVSTPYDEYPRYPIETLFEQGGDSEDTSILTAAILTRLGYDIVFFLHEELKHVALGINVPAARGYNWEYRAKKYYYLETTGEEWQLGQRPAEYGKVQPLIIPVGE